MQKDKVLQLMKLFSEKLGGSISDVKMMKLLYFTDRLCLLNTGHPVSYDNYYSLNRGPILSQTKAIIDANTDVDYLAIFTNPEVCHSPKGFPLKRFSIKENQKEHDALSEEEIDFAEQIFAQIGQLDDDDIVSYSHRKDICPEWSWPDGSRRPIDLESIFRTIGMDDSEIANQVKEINYHKRLLV